MSEMGDNPEHIPIGDTGAFIDFSSPVTTHWKVEEAEFNAACFEQCNPEIMVNELAHRSIANMSMNFWFNGGQGGELIVHIRARCEGPKRKLFRGRFCGILFQTEAVASLAEPPDADSESF